MPATSLDTVIPSHLGQDKTLFDGDCGARLPEYDEETLIVLHRVAHAGTVPLNAGRIRRASRKRIDIYIDHNFHPEYILMSCGAVFRGCHRHGPSKCGSWKSLV